MALFLEALIAAAAAFLLFVCLAALGERLYKECLREEQRAEEESRREQEEKCSGDSLLNEEDQPAEENLSGRNS